MLETILFVCIPTAATFWVVSRIALWLEAKAERDAAK